MADGHKNGHKRHGSWHDIPSDVARREWIDGLRRKIGLPPLPDESPGVSAAEYVDSEFFTGDEIHIIAAGLHFYKIYARGPARLAPAAPDLLRLYRYSKRTATRLAFTPKLDASAHQVQRAIDVLLHAIQRVQPAAFTKPPSAAMLHVWKLHNKKGRSFGAIANQKDSGNYIVTGGSTDTRLRTAKRWVKTVNAYLARDPRVETMAHLMASIEVVRAGGTPRKPRHKVT